MKKIFNLLLFILLYCSNVLSQSEYPKKIIQFGWDYPTISFLKEHLQQMEKRPFDGVAFSFDFKIYDLFDTTRYPINIFQLEELKSLSWHKFTHNFIRTRGQSLNGPQWLHDESWDNIVANLRNISKAVSVSGAKGILFDPEYYYETREKNPWIWDIKYYPGRSYIQVGAVVKKRGAQFINALEYYSPEIEILSLWMLSLIHAQSTNLPDSQTLMALYPFFVEGMIEGKNPESTLIDGNEFGYGYRTANQFVKSGNLLRKWGKQFMPNELKKNYAEIDVAQPIFYDQIYGTFPQYKSKRTKAQKNEWLLRNLYNAFKTSDKYVWFYNSKMNWWKGKIDMDIPEIIKSVKNTLVSEMKMKKKLKKWYSSDGKYQVKSSIDKDVFTYKYSSAKNKIKLWIDTTITKSIEIFENSNTIFYSNNPKEKMNFILEKFTGCGNLIILLTNFQDRQKVVYIN